MKKLNWNKLTIKIPHEVQIGPGTFYKICWVDKFNDKNQVGMMDFENKHIYIKIDQSPEEKVKTFLHECAHAFSDENDIKLTENQIINLENNVFYYLIKKGNIFK